MGAEARPGGRVLETVSEVHATARGAPRRLASEADIALAQQGNWHEELLFMLEQALARCDEIIRHLAGRDVRLDALQDVKAATKVDIGKAPRSGSKAPSDI